MEQMETMINFRNVGAALGYSTLGLVILAIAFITFDRLTPGKLWKEIVEEHNIALAIIVAGVTLAIAQIISSAIHG
jgi:putative membrane protein